MAVLTASAVQAAAPPPVSLRSTIIVPVIPKDWFVGTYSIDGRSELGEITPKDQGGAAYVDLIGFSVTPAPPAATLVQVLEGARAGMGARCPQPAVRDVADPAMPAWGQIFLYCLTPKDGDMVLEVTAMAFQLRDGYLFSTWRARREPFAKTTAFIKARLPSSAPIAGQPDGAWRYDEAALDAVTPGLAASLFAEIAKTEVCNLATGEICPSLRAPPELAKSTVAMLLIDGTNELTMRQTMTGNDGKPVSDFAKQTLAAVKDDSADKPFETLQAISLTDHDWSSGAGMAAALAQPLAGARSGGGTLSAVDHEGKADLATRGRMQAYVVMLSRLIWRFGVTPEREHLVLTAPAR
ncbi:hypothetical protein [Caulobacter sp.]|uniref:hypothetical protein n=1 Tax=Caulobacter sp. TaxID=78 RepID=UPI003BB123DE